MGKMTKRGLIRRIWIGIGITILWMILIFWFSAQDSTDSGTLSGNLLRRILKLFIRNWKDLSAPERWRYITQLHTLFRKLGHFTEYTVLGTLLALTMRRIEKFIHRSRQTRPIVWAFWLPALLALLYAASDELHQRFVPGRSCELRDVCIDFSGACLGIIIAGLIMRLIVRITHEEKE